MPGHSVRPPPRFVCRLALVAVLVALTLMPSASAAQPRMRERTAALVAKEPSADLYLVARQVLLRQAQRLGKTTADLERRHHSRSNAAPRLERPPDSLGGTGASNSYFPSLPMGVRSPGELPDPQQWQAASRPRRPLQAADLRRLALPDVRAPASAVQVREVLQCSDEEGGYGLPCLHVDYNPFGLFGHTPDIGPQAFAIPYVGGAEIEQFFGPTLAGLMSGPETAHQLAFSSINDPFWANITALSNEEYLGQQRQDMMDLAFLNQSPFGGYQSQFFGSFGYPGEFDANLPGLAPVFAGAAFDPALSGSILAALGPAYTGYDGNFAFVNNALTGMFQPAFGGIPGFGFSAPIGHASRSAVGARGVADLNDRYWDFGRQQVAIYYGDEALSTMRSDAYELLLFLICTDPILLFWDHELTLVLDQVRSTRPTYPALVSLANEIAGWTDPPADDQLLEERYAKRLLLLDLMAQVEYESLLYLLSNPNLLVWILQVNSVIELGFQAIIDDPTARAWYAGWRDNFDSTYSQSAGFADFVTQWKGLSTTYPEFVEYLQLRREVRDLTPQLASLVETQEVVTLTNRLVQDQRVANALGDLYSTYFSTIGEQLRTTPLNAEIERYQERLNLLVQRDPIYKDLVDIQQLTVLSLALHQLQVHDAVAICYSRYGTQCNPITDPNVAAIVFSDAALALFDAVGQFYEVYNLFWYVIYNSSGFRQLENDTLNRLQTAVVPVQQNIQAAQARFKQDVAAIPQIKTLRDAELRLSEVLYGTQEPRTAATVSTSAVGALAEVRQRLDQMSALARAISVSRGTRAYLPAILDGEAALGAAAR